MLIKKLLLKKIVSGGIVAEFFLVMDKGEYAAALYINGKRVGGPRLPQLLTPPKEDIIYWMGNRPGVGLTRSEAERILEEVEIENRILEHCRRHVWKS